MVLQDVMFGRAERGPEFRCLGGEMNEHKSVRPESVGQKPIQPETPGAKALRSEATMHTDAHVRKAGGRLSREDQRRLGDILQRVYDDVIHQGVPDRFKDLLTELEQRGDSAPGQSEAAPG